jgi:threonine dehydrogenase-like Zn-dependent dehydrogenase
MESIRVATFEGPGSYPQIQTVDYPDIPDHAGLIQVGACGVCGTDLHILQGHWPKPLNWPFTLGHEVAGILAAKGSALTEDYMGNPLVEGCKAMIPPLMPCGTCRICRHYPEHANKCLNPTYYGRYIPFSKAPHLWGGWAEMVYIDMDMHPATKVWRLPDDMSLTLGSLTEPLACCIRALNCAVKANGFFAGDTVVIQGSGPIGVLMVAAALEMGAGRVVVIGAPEDPRLALCRDFGAEATVSIEDCPEPQDRIDAVLECVGEYGADLVVDCAGHPSAGPEGIEMLRDGGTYVEMGQFTDAGSIDTNWHRFCAKDMKLVGSWGLTARDVAPGIEMLDRARDRFPWEKMQTRFEFSESGIQDAIDTALAMKSVKSTIIVDETIL